MNLILASNNHHKAEEIRNKLKNFKIITLKEAGIIHETEETGVTLEENALLKAKEIYDIASTAVISDDTGLFINELNGEPGVYSARYAGENASYEDNCDLVLEKLNEKKLSNSTAYFKTIMCLYKGKDDFLFFEGITEGKVINVKKGKEGFGYDPIFIPSGFAKTYAEMTLIEKNNVSHRAKALEELSNYLNNPC